MFFYEYYFSRLMGVTNVVVELLFFAAIACVMNRFEKKWYCPVKIISCTAVLYLLSVFFYSLLNYFMTTYSIMWLPQGRFIVIPLVALIQTIYPHDIKRWENRFTNAIIISYFLVISPIISSSVGAIFTYFTTYNAIATMTVQVLLIIGSVVFIKFFPFEKFKYTTRKIFVLLNLTFVFAYALEVMIDCTTDPENTAFMILHCSVLAVITILVYLAFYNTLSSYNATIEMQVLELKGEKEIEQLKLSQVRFDELHKIRHDLKNQFAYLSELVSQEKYDELQSYFSDLQEQVYVAIDFFDCGNPFLNSILNLEISKAKTHGCKLNLSVAVPKDYDFSTPDFVNLLSNMVDNAIEEIERDSLEDKNIDLKIYTNAGYLIVNCKNKVPENVTRVSLKSKKKERMYHGYGTKIIRNIAKNHNGLAEMTLESHVFSVHVMMQLENGEKAA